MQYAFHFLNKLATDGATMATERILDLSANKKRKFRKHDPEFDLCEPFDTLDKKKPPVIVCIGSDLAIGDCLGPITGSMLKYKTQGLPVFIYGTLGAPVTAKEIKYMRAFLKETHERSPVLAVDAAVGESGDIGLIKFNDSPLFPGTGANKKLGAVGDACIMGVVAEKSVSNYALLNTTRLHLVYSMSEIISDALASVLWERCSSA